MILGHVELTVKTNLHSQSLGDPAHFPCSPPGEDIMLPGCCLCFIAGVMKEVCTQGQMLDKNNPFAPS